MIKQVMSQQNASQLWCTLSHICGSYGMFIDYSATSTYILVGHCLAIEVYIDKLPGTGGVLVIIGETNDKRGSWDDKTVIGVHSTMQLVHPI